MAILCAPEIDLTIKVWPRVDAFSSLSRINQGNPKNNPSCELEELSLSGSEWLEK
jgi:hypothetical protein